MVYKPLAVRVALIAGFRRALPVFRYMIVAAVAMVMWESRWDFQGVWEERKTGLLAFHSFHAPAFPWLVFDRIKAGIAERGVRLDRRLLRDPCIDRFLSAHFADNRLDGSND
jgi:hypothetical protein